MCRPAPTLTNWLYQYLVANVHVQVHERHLYRSNL
ncbi:Uncharacterised protein [Klebsiella pneumoniae]|nr:Uncharacterised protein [Klebsiella pneumoniae]